MSDSSAVDSSAVQQAVLGGGVDWETITGEELAAYARAENARRSAPQARALTGTPDPDAVIDWRELALPGRRLPVRVYRPVGGGLPGELPLVLHVHGGGFVGTAVQSDWVNSHLAARLPALVVSVEHRLLAPDAPLVDAVDDGWQALEYLVGHAADWRIDPARVALFGESCGGLIAALAAVRAREAGLPLVAQVLVNPAVDVTETMLDYPSVTEHPRSPTVAAPQLRLFQRLAVPPGGDARAVSPLYADDLSGLAPALVVLPTHDPIADHGRRYADRLRAAGTSVRLTEYEGAPHAFLSMPGVVGAAAEAARAEVTEFLRGVLG